MAKFRGAVLNCVTCGAEFRVPPSRAATAKTCSHACAVPVRKKNRERKGILTCKTCRKQFILPRCHAERQIYCSHGCKEADPATKARKKSTRGSKNSQWRGGTTRHRQGYIYARVWDHPLAQRGYIMDHRLVMERWLVENEPDSPYLIRIGDTLHLSPAFHVHHRDEDKTNNRIENLQCMTPAEHRRHHNAIKEAALKFYRLHHPLT